MKKIVSLLCILSLFSCTDYLKEDSKSQMTLEYYYTERGMKEGVAAVYSSCREIFRENLFRVNIFSDLTESASSAMNSYDDVDNVSQGYLNGLFADIHQGIMIINRMERVIGEEPDTRTKEIYLAELRGFRAIFYQYQVELWGKYGHYQEKVYDEFEEGMLNINQKPVDFIYQQILKDIDYAITKLPTKSEIKEFGHLSQGAAKAFKARFLLAIAGYSHPEYSGQEEYNLYSKLGFASEETLYKEARTLAKSVINDYGYRLMPTYGDNFDEAKQVNDEVIWSVQWTTDKTYNTDASYCHRFGIGRACEVLILRKNNDGSLTSSTRSLMVKRAKTNGEIYNYSMPCHSMYYGREYRYYMPSFKWLNMFSSKDKRKEESFETLYLRIDVDRALPSNMTDTVAYMPFRAITLEEDKKHNDWVSSGDPKAYYLDGMNEVFDMDDPSDTKHYGGPLLHRSHYYSMKKFYDRSRVEMGKQEDGTANVSVLRLAEMYLIEAECAFKLREGDAAVYTALQPLWSRAFDDLSEANIYKPSTQMDINFILDEYSREVGMEFNSFFLLKRTRTLIDRVGKMPKSKEEEKSNILRFPDYALRHGNILYIKPLPLSQVNRFKNMSADKLPPGYDYGSIF